MRGVARILPVLLALFAAGTASANSLFGTSSDYFFASSTSLTDTSGRPMAVCAEARTTRIAALPFYRYASQYVIAPVDCTGTEVTPIPILQLEQGLPGVRRGVLGVQPTLKIRDLAAGFWGWIIVPIALMGIWVYRAYRRVDPAGRDQLLVEADDFAERAAGVMGLVAGHKGKLTRQQLTQIRVILNDLTKSTFEQQAVTEMATPAEEPLSQIPVDHLPDGLNAMQRAGLARAVATIAANSTHMSEDQQAFVDRVFNVLGIPTEPQAAGRPAMPDFTEATSPAE